MKETVLQFGTGNFLRGFADSFIDSMNKRGIYDGKVVIVSPTNSKTVEKLNGQNCKYHLMLRGIKDGEKFCEASYIESVSRAINPYSDFDSFISLASSKDLRFVISNTTEAGITFDPSCKFSDRPASSFPAKLTQLLYARYKSGLRGFVILSCELIDDNGGKLQKCVLDYAALWGLGDDFAAWIRSENAFCSTLVDRIVTGYPKDEAEDIFKQLGCRDELLDTAEPYHLWVIEGDYENELPLVKAGFNVIWTDDVSPYKKMKVRILNGSHTSLVFPSLLCGVETVGESLNDPLLRKFLDTCLFGYILPALGETPENRSFASAVLERFANPYIRHMWKSISLNSVSKFSARVLPTVNDCVKDSGAVPKVFAFSLACLIEYYKTRDVSDDANAAEFIKNNRTAEILAESGLWGEDLSFMLEAVEESLERIHCDGIREALEWAVS